MKQQLEQILASAQKELSECGDLKVMEELRVKFLGKKGELTAILKQMGGLSAEERPVIGQLANTSSCRVSGSGRALALGSSCGAAGSSGWKKSGWPFRDVLEAGASAGRFSVGRFSERSVLIRRGASLIRFIPSGCCAGPWDTSLKKLAISFSITSFPVICNPFSVQRGAFAQPRAFTRALMSS